MDNRYVPSLGWPRVIAIMMAVSEALFSIAISIELVTDHTCSGASTPHASAAVGLLAISVGLIALTIFTQRRMSRWVERRVRVRSAIGSIAAGALTLLPALVLAFGTAFVGGWFSVNYAFHICLRLGPNSGGAPFFFAGGC